MATTNFIDKETIIEASWLNDVDATVYQALNGAVSPAAARSALDVPQETPEIVPQVRINGAWQALSASVAPLHAATHYNGGTDQIDHDALLNGVGDKHVDHSVVEILGGSAMTGGGDLTATRTIAFSYILEQNLSADGNRVTNLAEPSTNQDAATKVYVDNKVIEGGGNPWSIGITPDSIYYSSGFVGIGTDTPIYDMDVRGTSQVTQKAIFGDDVEVSGSAGVGIVTPIERLDVDGNIQLSSTLFSATETLSLSPRGGNAPSFIDLNFPDVSANTSNVRLFRLTNNSGPKALDIYAGDNTATLQTHISATGSSYINAVGGHVGIGTASPAAQLDVDGDGLFSGTLGVTGNTTLDGASNVVNGDITASGAVTCQSTLSVTGAATLPNITGPTTLNGDLTLQ